ncbi:pyridoxamine 5'-phosphate oxidase family protein [Phytoactinopolyspora limicola]|uniref:pyridoxamine 5'-phosphate oxidase family protein n=1 Tax=Phytoactinopolyspora limicola TaxID=2715536 RepID=UPI001A9C4575|nr:pyridoxamine 5'-phosphate oxidase family protein [Phytoactinopolyspora limicola]
MPHIPAPEHSEIMPPSAAWPPNGAASPPEPASWEQALSSFTSGGGYWLATTTPTGRAQVRPVLSVIVDGVPHFSASEQSRKARNLAADPRCSITTSGTSFDVVIEGAAEIVSAEAHLHRVVEAYDARYGWRPDVRAGQLWADGAPTAGPPPYLVYRIQPATTYGFPTDESSIPTRWRFSPPA